MAAARNSLGSMNSMKISASDVLIPKRTAQFKRDVKRAKKRGKDIAKPRTLLALLVGKKPLPATYRDHPLHGIWSNYREAHIEPDWLLIYGLEGGKLRLVRTGTHSDLFKE